MTKYVSILVAVIIIGISAYYFGPAITGLIIKELSYAEEQNLVVTANINYTWQPQKT